MKAANITAAAAFVAVAALPLLGQGMQSRFHGDLPLGDSLNLRLAERRASQGFTNFAGTINAVQILSSTNAAPQPMKVNPIGIRQITSVVKTDSRLVLKAEPNRALAINLVTATNAASPASPLQKEVGTPIGGVVLINQSRHSLKINIHTDLSEVLIKP